MRTQCLCALAFLCGAGVAHAQGWGTDVYNNYNGYGQTYQTAAGGGYDYSQANGSAGYYPYANGYNYYNNPYAYAYQNYGYGYPQYPAAGAATGAPAGAAYCTDAT